MKTKEEHQVVPFVVLGNGDIAVTASVAKKETEYGKFHISFFQSPDGGEVGEEISEEKIRDLKPLFVIAIKSANALEVLEGAVQALKKEMDK